MSNTASGDNRPLIFISHLAANGEASRQLQDFIDARFLGAFRMFNTSAQTTLAPGDSWMDSIFSALRDSIMILAILTPESVRSPWVNFECGAAWLGGAKVIPCCGAGLSKARLPHPYSSLQALDLSDETDLDRLMTLIGAELSFSAPKLSTAQLALSLASSLLTSDNSDLASRNDGNRRERRVKRQWYFDRSQLDPLRWRAEFLYETEFEVLQRELAELPMNFTPSLEAVPFSSENPPKRELLDYGRSSPGDIFLTEPHRRTGSSFGFKIRFEPALRTGETASISLKVCFPEYHLGTREQLAAAQLQNGVELSDFRWSGRTVSQPTDDYIYEAILPKKLGATPVDPVVMRFSSTFDAEEEYLRSSGAFAVSEIEHRGEPCWSIRVHRRNPPRDTTYRLRWRVPSERHVRALIESEVHAQVNESPTDRVPAQPSPAQPSPAQPSPAQPSREANELASYSPEGT